MILSYNKEAHLKTRKRGIIIKKIFLLSLLIYACFILVGCEVLILETHDVLFYSNNELYHEVTVLDGDYLVLPKDPEIDNYKFEHWLYEDKVFDINKPVNKDMVLVANFTFIPEVNEKVKVTFIVDDKVFKEIEIDINTTVTPPSVTLENLTFEYWVLDGQAFDFSKPILENLVLTAKFKEITEEKDYYTIHFYDDNQLLNTQTIKAGSLVDEKLVTTSKSNMRFDGFYLDKSFTTPYYFNDIITKDLTVYGKWVDISEELEYLGYYDNVINLEGNDLKAALKVLLNTNITLPGYGDARYILMQADLKLGYSDTVYSIYNAKEFSNVWNGNVINREHVWPKSLFGVDSTPNHYSGIASDIHNLRVLDRSTNSSKNNRTFADSTGSNKTMDNWTYYPGDDHVGDVARIVFYMHVMWDLDISVVGDINMFISWHEKDPVDDFERNRNNFIYSGTAIKPDGKEVSPQGNRNPFIDYPNMVDLIFKNNQTFKLSIINENMCVFNMQNNI